MPALNPVGNDTGLQVETSSLEDVLIGKEPRFGNYRVTLITLQGRQTKQPHRNLKCKKTPSSVMNFKTMKSVS